MPLAHHAAGGSLQQRNAPLRFAFSTASKSSSLMRRIRLSRVMPALFTRISTRPKAFTACSKSALQPRQWKHRPAQPRHLRFRPCTEPPSRQLQLRVAVIHHNIAALLCQLDAHSPANAPASASNNGGADDRFFAHSSSFHAVSAAFSCSGVSTEAQTTPGRVFFTKPARALPGPTSRICLRPAHRGGGAYLPCKRCSAPASRAAPGCCPAQLFHGQGS